MCSTPIFSTALSLAGFRGGLESDIDDRHPNLNWIYCSNPTPYSRPAVRILCHLYNLWRVRPDQATIISCGGVTELIAGFLASCLWRCSLYSPGVPSRYYSVLKILSFLLPTRRIHLNTCDLLFAQSFRFARLYKNIPRFVVQRKQPVTVRAKRFDLIFVGRADKNKRFGELLTVLDRVCEMRQATLTVAHLGEPKLCSTPRINITAAGQVGNRGQVDEFISASRILCISSDYESSPRVFWESTSLGTPVASSACGNLRFVPEIKCQQTLDQLACHIFELLGLSNRELELLAESQNSAYSDCIDAHIDQTHHR